MAVKSTSKTVLTCAEVFFEAPCDRRSFSHTDIGSISTFSPGEKAGMGALRAPVQVLLRPLVVRGADAP